MRHLAKLNHGLCSSDPSIRSTIRQLVGRYMNGKVELSRLRNISVEGLWYWTHQIVRPQVFRESCPQCSSTTIPEIGLLTIRALWYLLSDPIRVFQMSTEQMEEYFASGRWRRDVHINWFLRQEQLRDDLYSLMLYQLGYRKEVLDTALHFVRSRHNASEHDTKERLQRELSQNEALREEILRSERIYHEYIWPLTRTPRRRSGHLKTVVPAEGAESGVSNHAV